MGALWKSSKRMIKTVFWWSGILVLALFLRFWNTSKSSFGLDEAFTALLAKQPTSVIMKVLEGDTHPPFHYLFVHVWQYFGKSDAFFRLSSIIFGMITLWFIFQIGRLYFSSQHGIIASIFWAVSVFAVHKETELRMYSLLTMLTTASLVCLWKCIKKGNIYWILYATILLLMLYTHYLAVFICIVELFLLFIIGFRRQVAYLMFAIILAVIPWVPKFLIQHKATYEFFAGSSLLYVPHINNMINAGAFMSGLAFLHLPSNFFIFYGLIWFIPVIWGAVNILLTSKKDSNKLWFLFSAILPFVFLYLWAILTKTPIFVEKYLIFLLPLWVILFVHGILTFPYRLVAFFVFAVILLINITGVYLINTNPLFAISQDWKAAAKLVEQEGITGDIILIEPPYAAIVFNRYYKQGALQFVFDKKTDFSYFETIEYRKFGGLPQKVITPGLIDELIKSRKATLNHVLWKAKRVWWIANQQQHIDPTDAIVKKLIRKFKFVKGWHFVSKWPGNDIRIGLFAI